MSYFSPNFSQLSEKGNILPKNEVFHSGRIPLLPAFVRLSSVFGRLQSLVFWYCLPKAVGLEGLPSPSTSQTFQGFSYWCVFLATNSAQSLVFKLKPTKASENGRPILLGIEDFVCKVYWFQNSAVV